MSDTINTHETIIFEENRRLNGYNIHLLDDWEMKIKKRFITPAQKEAYEKEFGSKVIKESEFFQWWKKTLNARR